MSNRKASKYEKIGLIITGVGAIIALLAWLFGDNVFGRLEGKPTFSFTFEGAFDQSKPEYEVAFPLRWNEAAPSMVKIIVNARYSGSKIQGPVYVKIQPSDANLPPVLVGEWTDFEAQSNKPITVSLSFQNLFLFTGQSEDTSKPDFSSDDPWGNNTGKFEIYVEHQGEKKTSQTVSVLNTPWFHEVYLSDYEFDAGHTVNAFITIFNHGAESLFEVNSCLFKVSTPTYALDFANYTSTSEGWWPEKGLERVCDGYEITQITLARDAQKTIIQPVSVKPLEEEGVYVFVSYVLKKTPIIEYQSDKDWFDARDIWLVRDGRQYVSFIVLRK